ncbi:MAG: PAS domain S-box protein [Candidatus Paceibacterota bacterium]|jgi:PAS domain S-box-containing protein
MKHKVSGLFYKELFDNMVDGLVYCQMVFDLRGNPFDFICLKINKNFEKITGLKKVIGKKATELIPEIKTSNHELIDICGQVSLTGESKSFEIYIKPLSRWFFISAYSPQKNFFVAIFQNITNRKKIEKDLENANTAALNVFEDLQAEKEALARAKAKDEALLESIGEGVVATDIFVSNDGKAHLNLITCGGFLDEVSKSYPKRLVVFADAE